MREVEYKKKNGKMSKGLLIAEISEDIQDELREGRYFKFISSDYSVAVAVPMAKKEKLSEEEIARRLKKKNNKKAERLRDKITRAETKKKEADKKEQEAREALAKLKA